MIWCPPLETNIFPLCSGVDVGRDVVAPATYHSYFAPVFLEHSRCVPTREDGLVF